MFTEQISRRKKNKRRRSTHHVAQQENSNATGMSSCRPTKPLTSLCKNAIFQLQNHPSLKPAFNIVDPHQTTHITHRFIFILCVTPVPTKAGSLSAPNSYKKSFDVDEMHTRFVCSVPKPRSSAQTENKHRKCFSWHHSRSYRHSQGQRAQLVLPNHKASRAWSILFTHMSTANVEKNGFLNKSGVSSTSVFRSVSCLMGKFQF